MDDRLLPALDDRDGQQRQDATLVFRPMATIGESPIHRTSSSVVDSPTPSDAQRSAARQAPTVWRKPDGLLALGETPFTHRNIAPAVRAVTPTDVEGAPTDVGGALADAKGAPTNAKEAPIDLTGSPTGFTPAVFKSPTPSLRFHPAR